MIFQICYMLMLLENKDIDVDEFCSAVTWPKRKWSLNGFLGLPQ